MIQRIQSLYLLFGAALVVLFLVFGAAWQDTLGAVYTWLTPTALVLGGLTALAALAAVFFYKDRALQRKIVLAAQWLCLALVLVLVGALAAVSLNEEATLVANVSLYLSLVLPLVAYVMLRLARRGVEKDIALVRSMDRLR